MTELQVCMEFMFFLKHSNFLRVPKMLHCMFQITKKLPFEYSSWWTISPPSKNIFHGIILVPIHCLILRIWKFNLGDEITVWIVSCFIHTKTIKTTFTSGVAKCTVFSYIHPCDISYEKAYKADMLKWSASEKKKQKKTDTSSHTLGLHCVHYY